MVELDFSHSDYIGDLHRDYLQSISDFESKMEFGRVNQIVGLVVESSGPNVFLGELCFIESDGEESIKAEVVGIKNDKVILMPFGDLRGIRLSSKVFGTGKSLDLPVGEALLGRVVDAFGKPLDGESLAPSDIRYGLFREHINPLDRPRIEQVLETGVKVIDSLLTVGRGQRMGIFAGSGVGKSSLLGMIARNMNADVNVIALVGERGREVKEFIESVLGPEGLKKSVVIVATSDQSPLIRSHAAWAATAIAEYFSDLGKNVVLTMDSITRFAMSMREIGLAVGEPPTARGYTPSVFAALPRLLERCGTNRSGGSITAFYTVLTEGDDPNDPLSDSIRAILDGGVVLTRDLANQRHFPAIDLFQSNSRLFHQLADEKVMGSAKKFVESLDLYERSKELINLGAYQKGSNPELDQVLTKLPKMKKFLQQGINERVAFDQSVKQLRESIL